MPSFFFSFHPSGGGEKSSIIELFPTAFWMSFFMRARDNFNPVKLRSSARLVWFFCPVSFFARWSNIGLVELSRVFPFSTVSPPVCVKELFLLSKLLEVVFWLSDCLLRFNLVRERVMGFENCYMNFCHPKTPIKPCFHSFRTSTLWFLFFESVQ